jgi:hypothetical protein
MQSSLSGPAQFKAVISEPLIQRKHRRQRRSTGYQPVSALCMQNIHAIRLIRRLIHRRILVGFASANVLHHDCMNTPAEANPGHLHVKIRL